MFSSSEQYRCVLASGKEIVLSGESMSYKGAWAADQSYAQYDVVDYLTGSYVVVATSALAGKVPPANIYGQAPTPVWSLITIVNSPSASFPSLASTLGGLTGSKPLVEGEDQGQVTGLGMVNPPTSVLLTVRAPLNSLVIFPTVLANTVTADGFQYALSGLPDSADYTLYYVVF